MPLIASQLRRRNNALFALAEEIDLKISRMTVADDAARDAIPSYVRLNSMEVKVLDSAEAGGGKAYYELGSDLTTWTELTNANYILSSEKGSPNGVATLDADGYIDATQIKNLFIADTYVVADQAAMLALSTTTGNIISLTDGADAGKVFIKLNNDDPADISDFAELTSSAAVSSVTVGEDGSPQTGAVSFTLSSLLAGTTDFSSFNTKVAASPSVTANTSAISAIQSDISDINAAIAVLEGLAVEGITLHEQTEEYEANRFVWANASVYRSLQNVPADTPITDTDYWEGGTTTFIGQSDTPSSYSGQALKLTRVNAAGNAIEFITGTDYYAPTTGSVEYWKTSGVTSLKTGTISVNVPSGSTNNLTISKSSSDGLSQFQMSEQNDPFYGVDKPIMQWSSNVGSDNAYLYLTSAGNNWLIINTEKYDNGVVSGSAGFNMNPVSTSMVNLFATDTVNTVNIQLEPKNTSYKLRFQAGSQLLYMDGVKGLYGSADFSSGYTDNTFVQKVYVLGAKTYSAKQTFFTPTIGSASLNLPHGVAPTSPADGDMWTTTAGLYIRIDGATVGPLGTGGGGSSTFLGLSDTPNSYLNQELKILRVNGGGDAVEFVDGSTLFAPVSGSPNYAPASGSSNYWKVSGTTAITGGTVLISQSAASSGDKLKFNRDRGNIVTYAEVGDQLTLLLTDPDNNWDSTLKLATGNTIWTADNLSSGGQARIGLDPGYAYIGYQNTAGGSVTGIYLHSTNGINLADNRNNRGAYYSDDYRVLGLSNYGHRWIPDFGAIVGAKTFVGKQSFIASTTSVASLNIAHGTAPTSPLDGDVWTTTTSIYARINGVTIDLGGAGSANTFSTFDIVADSGFTWGTNSLSASGADTLQLVEGNDITIETDDSLQGLRVGVNPAGNDNQILFNNNGVLGAFGSWDGTTMNVIVSASATNTSPTLLRVSHLTDQDPLTGYGSQFVFGATMQQGGGEVDQTTVRSTWADVNVGAEFSILEILGYYNGTAREFARFGKNTKGTSAYSLELGPNGLGVPVRIEPRNSASTMSLYGNRMGPSISHAFDMNQSSGQTYAVNLPFDISGQTGTAYFDGINLSITASGRASSGAVNLLKFFVDSANVVSLDSDGIFTIKDATAPTGDPSVGQSYLYIDSVDGHIKQKISDGTVYDLTTGAGGGSSDGVEYEVQLSDGAGGFTQSGLLSTTPGNLTLGGPDLVGSARYIYADTSESEADIHVVPKSTGHIYLDAPDINIGYASNTSVRINASTGASNVHLLINAKGTGYVELNSKLAVYPDGRVQLDEMVAPTGTPGSSTGWVYIDSSDSKIKFKNDQGTVYDLTGSGGGGSPAGADGAVQYNNGGAFGGVTELLYDDGTGILTYNGGEVSNSKLATLTDGASVSADCEDQHEKLFVLDTAESTPAITFSNVKVPSLINLVVKTSAACTPTFDGTDLLFKGYGDTPSLAISGAGVWEYNILVSGLTETVGGGGEQLEDSYSETNRSGSWSFYDYPYHFQVFQATNTAPISKATLNLYKQGTVADTTMNCYLYSITGTPGTDAEPNTLHATATGVSSSVLGTSNQGLVDFLFEGAEQYELQAGTWYAIVAYHPNQADGSNTSRWGIDSSTPTHPGNSGHGSPGSWSAFDFIDKPFYIYTDDGTGTPKDVCIVAGPEKATNI